MFFLPLPKRIDLFNLWGILRFFDILVKSAMFFFGVFYIVKKLFLFLYYLTGKRGKRGNKAFAGPRKRPATVYKTVQMGHTM